MLKIGKYFKCTEYYFNIFVQHLFPRELTWKETEKRKLLLKKWVFNETWVFMAWRVLISYSEWENYTKISPNHISFSLSEDRLKHCWLTSSKVHFSFIQTMIERIVLHISTLHLCNRTVKFFFSELMYMTVNTNIHKQFRWALVLKGFTKALQLLFMDNLKIWVWWLILILNTKARGNVDWGIVLPVNLWGYVFRAFSWLILNIGGSSTPSPKQVSLNYIKM